MLTLVLLPLGDVAGVGDVALGVVDDWHLF